MRKFTRQSIAFKFTWRLLYIRYLCILLLHRQDLMEYISSTPIPFRGTVFIDFHADISNCT